MRLRTAAAVLLIQVCMFQESSVKAQIGHKEEMRHPSPHVQWAHLKGKRIKANKVYTCFLIATSNYHYVVHMVEAAQTRHLWEVCLCNAAYDKFIII